MCFNKIREFIETIRISVLACVDGELISVIFQFAIVELSLAFILNPDRLNLDGSSGHRGFRIKEIIYKTGYAGGSNPSPLGPTNWSYGCYSYTYGRKGP